jgi:hypothetical protein
MNRDDRELGLWLICVAACLVGVIVYVLMQ